MEAFERFERDLLHERLGDRVPGLCAHRGPGLGGRRGRDYDGSGEADVVRRRSTLGLDGIWLMNGAAISSTAGLPTVTDTGWKLVGPRRLAGLIRLGLPESAT